MNNNQRDPRWANIILGTSTLTIGAIGCFISCIGDAIGTTPDVVNERLNSVEGYDEKDLVDWAKLAQAFPGITATVKSTYDNQDVLNQLAAGNRVLVVVSAVPIGGTGIHCVEYIGNGQLKDPWTGTIRPTSDFPTLTGEYIIISGQWQDTQNSVSSTTIKTTDLNTYGLDPTNQQSNQAVFDAWHALNQGLYVPAASYNAEKQTVEDLQKTIDELNSKHVEDTKEISDLNHALSTLAGSNKDYAGQALESEKTATQVTNDMIDVADELGVDTNGKTEQELHQEIIQEIAANKKNQTAESDIPPEKLYTLWEEQFQSIVNNNIRLGLNKYLTENNLHIVDLNGNPMDADVATYVNAFNNDTMSRLAIFQKAGQAVSTIKEHVGKSRNLFAQILGVLWSPQGNA